MKSKLMYLLLVVSIVSQSCSKKHKETKVEKMGEKMIEVPCAASQSKEYASNKTTFRASGIGESLDQQISKDKAVSNARASLAQNIQGMIKATIDNYANSRELNNKEEVEERYEKLIREVINQELNNVKTICEKQVITGENKYKTYLCIEMGAEDLKKAVDNTLSKNEKSKIDYDYEKFKQTFDKEMEKFE